MGRAGRRSAPGRVHARDPVGPGSCRYELFWLPYGVLDGPEKTPLSVRNAAFFFYVENIVSLRIYEISYLEIVTIVQKIVCNSKTLRDINKFHMTKIVVHEISHKISYIVFCRKYDITGVITCHKKLIAIQNHGSRPENRL